MAVVIFVGAGLLAFGLSFWLTRRLRHLRPGREPEPQAGLLRRSPQNGASSPSSLNPPDRSPVPDLDRQVRDLLGQGRLIDAVKRVREVNGCSLSDAKAYVAERLP